ncbi:hypothetical protein ATSB10_30080 [Dyella thiooxydans]|uniref:Uncharacterized protein n=1 Tax=Dyella thiooxydans TaxID=445710 RepID=A0A160N4M6_9GAMM|nr:hypothetical protein ATSB10_30080 [Dyella thiooxydans]
MPRQPPGLSALCTPRGTDAQGHAVMGSAAGGGSASGRG